MTIARTIGLATTVAFAFGMSACTEKGAKGTPGTSCTVTDNGDGSKVITCTDGTTTTVNDGSNSVVTATVQGTISNKLTNAPVAGATVTLNPAITGVTIVTDTAGAFSATLPIGSYTLTYAAKNYTSSTDTLALVAGAAVTKTVLLVPTANVAVTVASDTPDPVGFGAVVTLTANILSLDSSVPATYAWSVSGGPALTLDTPTAATTTVTITDLATYKANLFALVQTPDRFGVVGINPLALEESTASTFQVTVTMDNGKTYTGTGTVNVNPLGLVVSTGLANVPVRVPALLHAPTSAAPYDWHVVTQHPGGLVPSFDNAGDQNVIFTPQDEGQYVIASDEAGTHMITVYAGEWIGAISGPDLADGHRDVTSCQNCHAAMHAPTDPFDEWRLTGHADIFTANLDAPGHYSTACFSCHTVGYNTDVNNNGVDDQSTYPNFLAAFTDSHGIFKGAADTWAKTTENYAAVAKFGNVQCESCHGPNSTLFPQDPTMPPDPTAAYSPHSGKDALGKNARVSLDSAVCASCHGEPPRHGRFQQWQESGHADFDLAINESSAESHGASATSAGAASCARCHSAQGFLAWIDLDDLSKCLGGGTGTCTPINDSSESNPDGYAGINKYLKEQIGLTDDKIQPVGCAACHDPHDVGTSSGNPNNNAHVRITGDTKMLPSGFRATSLGRGALCITCHNSRNGAHNDSIAITALTFDRAPHVADQGDVFMGENAYFVDGGQRSPHANVSDGCTNCHLEKTAPPAEFSFNLGGTNHAFVADPNVCASCHGPNFSGANIAGSFEMLADFQTAISDQIVAKLSYLGTYKIAKAFLLNGTTTVYSTSNAVDNITVIPTSVELLESSGRIALHLHLPHTVTVPFLDANSQVQSTDTLDIYSTLANVMQAGTTTKVFNETYTPLDGSLWNYFLLHSDQSNGVHNPAFAFDVINASTNKLQTDSLCTVAAETLRCANQRLEICEGLWTLSSPCPNHCVAGADVGTSTCD